MSGDKRSPISSSPSLASAPGNAPVAQAGNGDILFIGSVLIAAHLEFPALIESLRSAFAEAPVVPSRHHHDIKGEGRSFGTLLLMPSCQRDGKLLGVKNITINPGNSAIGLPATNGIYFMCDGRTGGNPIILDASELTSRRTIASSALAADYLARRDAHKLLIVGAGRIASLATDAFSAVRPIDSVTIWNRTHGNAEKLAQRLREKGVQAQASDDLEAAVRDADIVHCATLSVEPLIRGEWLDRGTLLDMVGAFTPSMKEADPGCFAVSRVFIDVPDALHEAGDVIAAIRSGAIVEEEDVGTLAQLCRGEIEGRRTDSEITMFKSVGSAIADFAAARLVHSRVTGQ